MRLGVRQIPSKIFGAAGGWDLICELRIMIWLANGPGSTGSAAPLHSIRNSSQGSPSADFRSMVELCSTYSATPALVFECENTGMLRITVIWLWVACWHSGGGILLGIHWKRTSVGIDTSHRSPGWRSISHWAVVFAAPDKCLRLSAMSTPTVLSGARAVNGGRLKEPTCPAGCLSLIDVWHHQQGVKEIPGPRRSLHS
jgi:hypothetical protein